jgi:hypothetical protein
LIAGGVQQAKVEKLGFTDKGPKKEKTNTPFANALSSDEDEDDDDFDDSDDLSEDA